MLALCNATIKNRAENISLELNSGELLALIGPNGAGKSSVIAMISGLIPQTSEQATLANQPLNKFNPAKLAQRRAVMEQKAKLPYGFSVREVVQTGTYQHKQNKAVNQALDLTFCTELSARKTQTLSGGEVQRVMLARALTQLLYESSCERYLLLDEPTAAMDISIADNLMALIHKLAHELNFGVLCVLHDINLAARHSDRIGLMYDKKLLAIGKTKDIMQTDKLEKLYGLKLTKLEDKNDASVYAFIPKK